MSTKKDVSRGRGHRTVRDKRSEKYARKWAAAIHVELLAAWGRADEGPMPTRADAERVAAERVALLREGLGDWADLAPTLLDENERQATKARGWRRNAWPRRRRRDRDDGPWWGYLWDEDD